MKSMHRYFVLLAFLAVPAALGAGQCSMSLSVCPKTFDHDTIDVPNEVTGIAPAVPVCNDAPAVGSFFFLIDNSGSMKGINGSDPTGARFTVTSALLDTLYAQQPQTEVGLAVIQELLYFSASSSNYWFAKYFKAMSTVYDSEPNQAYVPFLTLNKLYDGIRGIDILDSILLTTGSGGNMDLRYQPNYIKPLAGRTNINIGFLAAREAFANATAPKDQQYVIFLSDGEANQGQNDPGSDSVWYWRDSTRNVPTTFTVFFTFSNGVPAGIQTMTQNIRNNGYSPTNPTSAVWSVQASFASLMNVLLTNVFRPISGTPVPVQMIVNTTASITHANGCFVFPDTFPLASNGISPFSVYVTYVITNPSTSTTTATIDTTVFCVRHSSTAAATPGITVACSQNAMPFGDLSAAAVRPKVSVFHRTGHTGLAIRYALPSQYAGTDVSIGIYTMKGRLVAGIRTAARKALSELVWDEKDASRTPVGPGTYIVRLIAAEGTMNLDSRFVIVR